MRKFFVLLCMLPLAAQAQWSRLTQDISYRASLTGTTGSGDVAPFWFTSNRYGLATSESSSLLLRADIQRSAEADSLRKWRVGYGLSAATAVNFDSKFVLQQLFADVQYKAIRLSMGMKERPMELKNQALSSGALTSGINARPIPQIRLELPEFWSVPGTKDWLALKAHIAYGAFTDNKWQREHQGVNGHYAANVLYHSKAGFLKIGNESAFPLSLTGGLEMYTQFGGEAWNVDRRGDDTSDFDATHVKMGHGLSQFIDATLMKGSDAADGDYKNASGNQLGSWHLRLDYTGKGWKAAAYAEHFFEDHSQLFWQYGWKDMLYGLEIGLPSNRFLSGLVYEHLRTTDQSGSIYHDKTTFLPDQISGRDEYYNHGTYTGWHHAGMAMGTPLLVSPIYNGNHIYFLHNRITAHHIGLNGNPTSRLAWRILYTHEKSLGTYRFPLTDPQHADYLLAEVDYQPKQVPGLSIKASYGMNKGKLLGESHGAMLTVAYSGWINHRK